MHKASFVATVCVQKRDKSLDICPYVLFPVVEQNWLMMMMMMMMMIIVLQQLKPEMAQVWKWWY